MALLTAEGEVWKRSRKAMAPVFTPRHITGFADMMLTCCETFCERYTPKPGEDTVRRDVSHDMTELTYEILATTLFSNQIVGDQEDFAGDVEKLLNTMGRVDPMDLLKAPGWVPRIFRLRGASVMRKFRKLVRDTANARRQAMALTGKMYPRTF